MINVYNIITCMQMRLDDITWKEIVIFVDWNSKHNERNSLIVITELQVTILQHRLIVVYWMLKHEREKCENDLLKDESNYEKITQYYVLYFLYEQSLMKSLIITDNNLCYIFESQLNDLSSNCTESSKCSCIKFQISSHFVNSR